MVFRSAYGRRMRRSWIVTGILERQIDCNFGTHGGFLPSLIKLKGSWSLKGIANEKYHQQYKSDKLAQCKDGQEAQISVAKLTQVMF